MQLIQIHEGQKKTAISNFKQGDEIEENEMDRVCRPIIHGKIRNAYKSLVGKIVGKKQLGKFRSTWEGNTKMYCHDLWA
jgi:hypothetical protein